MNEWLKYLLEFEGIVGALSGVALTLILSHLIRNSGRIYCEVTNSEISYYDLDAWGAETPSNKDSAERVSIKFTINFYNKSEIPKPIKAFRLELLDKSKNIIDKVHLNDEDTKRFSAGSFRYETLRLLNLQPKQLAEKELSTGFTLKDQPKFRNIEYLNLVFQNAKGKEKKIKIL